MLFRSGVKFNDADLIGLPVRLTLSARTLRTNSAELKPRRAKEYELAPLQQVPERLGEMLADLSRDVQL